MYRIGRGLLGLLLLGSLLACTSGACNLDMSSFGDTESKPRLGLTLQEGAITVIVPTCVGAVERITLVDSDRRVVWDLRSLSPTALPDSFRLGRAPQGFFDVQVAYPGQLDPEESYQLVVGAAPEGGGGNISQPTTTATTATTAPPPGGPPASDPTTTSTAPSPPTTDSEFFDEALAVGSFEPKQVPGDSILVGSSKVGLAEFSKEACKEPDSTTTTR